MSDPHRIRPDEVEILVAREIRKLGVSLVRLHVTSRRALAADDDRGYVVELAGRASSGETNRDVLVEFRNETALTAVNHVRALATRVAAPETDGPKRLQPHPAGTPGTPCPDPLRFVVSTSGFDLAALRAASALGVVPLRVADGRAAFLRSQWSMGDQPPAWVPEYMTELGDVGPTGDARYQLVSAAATASPKHGAKPGARD
ncbi:MAG TPA: hypothetical protein VM076_21480 [Gemmatimonadaceae bacterium]|nr:hypothetical protein [Gemmatimonadaceae bacterium]